MGLLVLQNWWALPRCFWMSGQNPERLGALPLVATPVSLEAADAVSKRVKLVTRTVTQSLSPECCIAQSERLRKSQTASECKVPIGRCNLGGGKQNP